MLQLVLLSQKYTISTCSLLFEHSCSPHLEKDQCTSWRSPSRWGRWHTCPPVSKPTRSPWGSQLPPALPAPCSGWCPPRQQNRAGVRGKVLSCWVWISSSGHLILRWIPTLPKFQQLQVCYNVPVKWALMCWPHWWRRFPLHRAVRGDSLSVSWTDQNR